MILQTLILPFFNDSALDINSNFNRLLSILDELEKTHTPLKKLTKREDKFRNKPWINGKIQKMMRIRDRILRKYKKNNNQSLINLHKQFRN